MNLLCPSCSTLLTVPEQYAGMRSRCPKCQSEFTVPALPPGGGLDAPAQPQPAAPPPQPAFSQPSAPTPQSSGPSAQPAFDNYSPTGANEPAFAQAGPAAPKGAVSTGPGLAPQSPPGPRGDYTSGFALTATEKILQWVPPGALLLIFVLQIFFPWVGVYLGNVPVATQCAWSAAYGRQPDANVRLKEYFAFTTDAKEGVADNRPGASLLLILYTLLFLLALPVTIAIAVLPFLQVPLPPQVQQLLGWKWAIVVVLNAVLLLFLALQMVFNFGLESSVSGWAESVSKAKTKAGEDPDPDVVAARVSNTIGMVKRTFWLKLAFFFHVVATAAAALVFWIDKRGPSQPLPMIQVRW